MRLCHRQESTMQLLNKTAMNDDGKKNIHTVVVLHQPFLQGEVFLDKTCYLLSAALPTGII